MKPGHLFRCWLRQCVSTVQVAFCKRASIFGWAFSSILIFAHPGQAVHAATNTCHFSDAELAQILGAELSVKLVHSVTAGQPGVRCEGNFLFIDFSRLPAPALLKFGVPVRSVRDQYPFAGLASYYQRLQGVSLNADKTVAPVSLADENQPMAPEQWLGVQGRYQVFLVSAPGAILRLDEAQVELRWTRPTTAQQARVFLGKPGQGEPADTGQSTFSELRYTHLWAWLASLCLGIEKLLLFLQAAITANWGVAIILLAVTLKLLLLPVSLFTAKTQAHVNRLQAQLQPKLNAIKESYDGEEAHTRSMAAYKSLGVSPFFALRPLPGTLIQLPILVATFNVLGEMPQLQGAEFLWIDNLAYPDAVAALPFAVPAMGNQLNLLPFIMLLVSLLATVAFSAPHSSAADSRRQKRNLYLMSAAFFFLFYPFPAAMVLYWTVNNALQLIQQRLLR